MNDPGFLTIVAWRTYHKKRQARAEHFSKDYGLSKLQPCLYVGRLSIKEKQEFAEKLTALFSGKHDRLHLFSTCRSCAIHSSAPEVIANHYKETTFEIV